MDNSPRLFPGRALSVFALTLLITAAAANAQQAQPGRDIPVPQQTTCPPGTSGGPTIGSNQTDANLSDQLAQSRGIICPPAGIDPEIKVTPPDGGRMPVIAPPGSPGGNQAIQPK